MGVQAIAKQSATGEPTIARQSAMEEMGEPAIHLSHDHAHTRPPQ